MTIQEADNRGRWNDFLREHAPRSGAFLHAWEWGEFQRAAGHAVRRVVASDDRGPAVIAQVIENNLPLGQRYLFCPRGPIHRPDAVAVAPKVLTAVAKKTNALFARFEPSINLPACRQAGNLHPVFSISPPNTLLTDLTSIFDDLSRAQHPKTRYNIGLAERKGVVIELHSQAFDEAWNLFETTAARGQFRLHPRRYYERMLSALTGDACHAFLAVARYEGKAVAANVMIDHAGTRTYLHGASANVHREVMAPYLLHWALLSEAKHQGMHWYDWWGIAPEGAGETHPWAGISRFKLGFGGTRVDYPGTFDLVTRPTAYRLYQISRRLRRALRHQ